jgi:NAD(P)-dependent dehydrogenase (short-subunit alcohol dehydrogenase family)
VTVNAISPGMFPLTEANRDLSPADTLDRLSQFTPEGRTGDVRELASALLFLVSPDSTFITGQNIVVDGGWTLW